MSKIKLNEELLKLMDDYTAFMDSDKNMAMPVTISKYKTNHEHSLIEDVMLIADIPFGNTIVEFEIKDDNSHKYTIGILTDRIKNKMMARLDEGNGTHKNNIPDVPLAEQQVTTPHFHKYHTNGYLYAYKTEVLEKQGSTPMPLKEGLIEFCREEHISSSDGAEIDISINIPGVIPFEQDIDPLNGISFKNEKSI